jgi:quinol monooxygenase YgiN
MEGIISTLLQNFERGKITRRLLIQRLALAATGASAASAAPVAAQAEELLYVVTYVDVVTPSGDTAKVLQDFATASRKDPGCARFEVMRSVDRPNHFAIVEVWRTREEYEAHLGLSHTKQLRETIQPGLGSPFDERLYHKLP